MVFDEARSSHTDNWSVILQSYSPKLKKELAKKLVDIFNLEKKDSEQAVSNTPLILLDDLSFGMAARIKNFFAKTGAVVETTNHDMIKRNCYQVVWPSTPDLSFFLKDEFAVPQAQVASPEKKEPEVVPAKSAPKPEPKKSLFDRFKAPEKKIEPKLKSGMVPAAVVSKATESAKPAEVSKISETKKAELPAQAANVQDGLQRTREEAEAKSQALVNEIGAAKERCTHLEQQIREMENVLLQKEAHARDVEKALAEARVQENERSGRIDQLNKQLSEMKDLSANRGEAQTFCEELKKKVAHLESSLSEKEKERASILGSLEEWKKKVAHLEGELAGKEGNRSAVQAPVDELTAKVAALERALAEKEKECAQANEAIQEWEQEIVDFEKFLTTKESERTHILSSLEEQQAKVTELEKLLHAKETEKATIHGLVEEWKGKVTHLEGILAAKENEQANVHGTVEEGKSRIAHLESTLAGKENDRAALHGSLEEAKGRIAHLENELSNKEKDRAGIQAYVDELRAKIASLEGSLAEKEKECTFAHETIRKWEEEAVNFEKFLESKEAERVALQTSVESWRSKMEELEGLVAAGGREIERLKAESADSRAKERDLVNQAEALQRSLTELNNALRDRESLLKMRDESIVSLNRRIDDLTVQGKDFDRVRQEHARLSAENATVRQEFEAKFTEQEARIVKIEEEGRRYRSRMDRKVAAATRELGEWARNVDSLRQGLQKLTTFIGSDVPALDTEKKSPIRSIFNKPAKPAENNPQQPS